MGGDPDGADRASRRLKPGVPPPRAGDGDIVAIKETTHLMIVSHRYEFVFIAVPRTGSHAIGAALQPHFGPDDWLQEQRITGALSPIPALARIRHGHVTVRQARRHLPEAVWREYFKWSVIREPYDWYVSACASFECRNSAWTAGNRTEIMKRGLTGMKGGPVTGREFRKLRQLRPQTSLLLDESGQLGVDFVALYERLQADFSHVCRTVGLADRKKLPVVNANEQKPAVECLDDELRELVRDVYRRDFEMWEEINRRDSPS